MRSNALLLTVILILITSSSAQSPISGNAFLGYSFTDASPSAVALPGWNRLTLNGWRATAEVKAYRWIGIAADFSGHYGSGRQSVPGLFVTYDGRQHDFLFGPRVSASFGRVRPFAEGLFGVTLISTKTNDFPISDSSFAFAVGGGVDYKLIGILGLRVQGDYLRTGVFTLSQNDLRLSTGAVLRF
jgi:opacity protein-like surface antigen